MTYATGCLFPDIYDIADDLTIIDVLFVTGYYYWPIIDGPVPLYNRYTRNAVIFIYCVFPGMLCDVFWYLLFVIICRPVNDRSIGRDIIVAGHIDRIDNY